uniref:Uncharacterized protein n=1 Tax=Oryza glumipatula TaxID=40148 RepID=A0A0D9ZUD0_9ORYZ
MISQLFFPHRFLRSRHVSFLDSNSLCLCVAAASSQSNLNRIRMKICEMSHSFHVRLTSIQEGICWTCGSNDSQGPMNGLRSTPTRSGASVVTQTSPITGSRDRALNLDVAAPASNQEKNTRKARCSLQMNSILAFVYVGKKAAAGCKHAPLT